MSKNLELTDIKHWEDAYKNEHFYELKEDEHIYKSIVSVIPKTNTKSSFEVGIYPGTFSEVFGKLGYEVNGIDRVSKINSVMRPRFLERGYKIGNLIEDDFFKFQFDRKYDLVASFGFIEHFKNFEEIIQRQILLVENDGYIIVETPNFNSFVQRSLKRVLDNKNLDIHYAPSMNFDKWKKILLKNDFEIISQEYVGGFTFLTYPQKRNLLQKFLIKVIRKSESFLQKYIFKGESKHYSTMMIMIAKKIK